MLQRFAFRRAQPMFGSASVYSIDNNNMGFSTMIRALRNMYLESNLPEKELPDLAALPPRSTLYNLSTLTDSITKNRLLSTRKHMNQDPRAASFTIHDDFPWKGPQYVS